MMESPKRRRTEPRQCREARRAASATDGQLTFLDHVLTERARRTADPDVWTDRMLTALVNGVKGGTWHSLIDKVWAEPTLRAAFERVKRNRGAPGVDHVSVRDFERHLSTNLGKTRRELREGSYRPRAVRRTWVDKPGSPGEKRPLGIPTVRDRVVQTALKLVIEPIFEAEFARNSHGFRPNRGCRDALRRVARALRSGRRYVLDADLKSYFDTIPHERMMAKVRRRISDGRVLSLIEAFLKAEVFDGSVDDEWIPEDGTPQGAVISPLLANLYLDDLDHEMEEAGHEMVRYADDFVVLCRTREDAEEARRRVQAYADAHGLTLHPTKTMIVDGHEEGFDFLGYQFRIGRVFVSRKSLKRLRGVVKLKTPRKSSWPLDRIIRHLNKTLRGWYAYFKHASRWQLAKVDSFVRRRVRSILMKRRKKQSKGWRGKCQYKWPNAFFHGHGLLSLENAHRLDCQSLQGAGTH